MVLRWPTEDGWGQRLTAQDIGTKCYHKTIVRDVVEILAWVDLGDSLWNIRESNDSDTTISLGFIWVNVSQSKILLFDVLLSHIYV